MVSIGANESDVPDAERIEGDTGGREGTFLGEKGSAAAGDELFWGENGRLVLPLVVGLLASGFSNACLADEEIGECVLSGIEGAEFEVGKLAGRGVTGIEARGDGVGGIESRPENAVLPCCRNGVCGPDCDVLPLSYGPDPFWYGLNGADAA